MGEAGILPCDYIEILYRGMSKNEAHKIEVLLITEHCPKFNHNHNPAVKAEKRKELKDQVVALRERGLFYSQIALELNTSITRVWNAANE